MKELHFESKELEEYFYEQHRILGFGYPSYWHDLEVITQKDVDLYVKDAKNILAC